MNRREMFKVLQTCIIGESFRACGVGYDPGDALETYHAIEFDEDYGEDEVKGGWTTPEHFLESLCSSNAGRVYETLRAMESAWKFEPDASKTRTFCTTATMALLWGLGNSEAVQFIDDNFGQDAAQEFLDYGSELFDDF